MAFVLGACVCLASDGALLGEEIDRVKRGK